MTDDIVARLNNFESPLFDINGDICGANSMLEAAADEIEQLRAERALLLERMRAIIEAVEDNNLFRAEQIARAALGAVEVGT